MVTAKCPLCCGETFSSFLELKIHIFQILENLKCYKCPQIFTNSIELLEHLNGVCNVEEDEDNELIDLDTTDENLLVNESVINNEEIDLKDNLLKFELEHNDIKDNYDCNTDTNIGAYFCQVCSMHFDVVEDHLRTYHEGQEILVEDDSKKTVEDSTDESTLTYINEDPQLMLSSPVPLNYIATEPIKKSNTITQLNVKDKAGNLYTRKFVKIDKFWLQAKDREVNNRKDPIIYTYQFLANNEKDDEANIQNNTEIIEINQCPDCSLLFTNLENYKKHKCNNVVTLEENSENLKCNQCDSVFEEPDILSEHLKTHLKKPHNTKSATGPFTCEICNTNFPMFKSLRLHRRMHEPIKLREIEAPANYQIELEPEEINRDSRPMFYCKICNKTYDKQYETIHIESHNSNNSFNCKVCNRKFFNQQNLDMHMKAHSNNKKFSCSYCKKPFITFDALQEHLSNQCQKRMYACQYCGRRFTRPHEKVKHERIHTGEKPHTCEICGKTFRVSYCLTLHLRTHSGVRPYQCFTCGKRFKSHSVYNHHLLTHSEVRKYKCPYCPKTFKTSPQLAGHKNSHTKPFTCTECNRPFASLYAVRAHMETHKRDNNLKYECCLCGALYSRAFALRDHIKQHHLENGVNTDDNKEEIVLNVVEEIDAANSILVKEDEFIMSLDESENIETEPS